MLFTLIFAPENIEHSDGIVATMKYHNQVNVKGMWFFSFESGIEIIPEYEHHLPLFIFNSVTNLWSMTNVIQSCQVSLPPLFMTHMLLSVAKKFPLSPLNEEILLIIFEYILLSPFDILIKKSNGRKRLACSSVEINKILDNKKRKII